VAFKARPFFCVMTFSFLSLAQKLTLASFEQLAAAGAQTL
jgi:hypothetical protein